MSAMNGTSSNGAAPIGLEPQKVYRSHDADRTAAIASNNEREAARTKNDTTELEKLLAGIASKIDAAAARVEEAAKALVVPVVDEQEKVDFQKSVDAASARGELHTIKRKDGAVEYSLPMGDVRLAGYTLSGKREAFVDHEKRLEVVGTSDVHMKAAMEHAKRKWVGDDIVIHAKGEHLDRAIKYAVASGLNVVNADRNVQEKVTVERERQQAPARAVDVPVIQRVSRSA